MDWETFNPFHATGVFRYPLKISESFWFGKRPVALKGLIRARQISAVVKIVRNVNLVTTTSLANTAQKMKFSIKDFFIFLCSEKILTLDVWLGQGCASADLYITVLKIQTKICKDGRRVKMESC